MGLREVKMQRTRLLIADKALELFAAQGFEATTIEQVAAAAEVGTRTLYRYFPTKESLIAGFVEEHLTDSLEVMRAQPADRPLPEALHAVLARLMRVVAEDSDRVVAVYALARHTDSLQARLAEQTWRWRDELATEIAARIGGPSVRLVAALAAATAMGLIEVVLREWVDGGGTRPLPEITRDALKLLHAGAVPLPEQQGH
ncbi:helix-turn-helix domain containing protein [Crossiella sp. CA-258035]|uniref:TetR/AcrR family transcriptional regulator n=1 Tax=Crossiella sp. CA-258035 TaxID=2981138 RepID=UPI0024BC5B67|nr:TetR/AcrR family transcriptional regulator [Crossiella sp. CA-258035]WHT17306.1 helix-turn-helix domain containing protein [Crossiella sp. CA-258035]